MQVLAQEYAERAERAPDEVAVVDASGAHTVGEVMQAARDLAALLEAALGGSPTVLVQADNTWRTLAAALAVGLRGGMVAVFSSHAVAAEFELAVEDIAPDALFAAPDVLQQWAVSERCLRRTGVLPSTAGRSPRLLDRSAMSAAGRAAPRSR